MSIRYFVDTSALVKLYHREEGTEILDGIVRNKNATIVISALSKIELTSALARKARMNELTQAKYEDALRFFSDELSKFEVVPLNDEVLAGALNLIQKLAVTTVLRILDALQLSAGIIASKRTEVMFVVSDKKLLRVAESQDLRVVPIAIEE